MSKRTTGKFERRDRDFYATPAETTYRLLPFLGDCEAFAEPMCGDGAIIRALEARGWPCRFAGDIEPQGEMTERARSRDVLHLSEWDVRDCSHIISNPPWPARFGRGQPTIGIIAHLMSLRPTWLILSADWKHNGYALPLLEHCPKIVSAGRVKWMEDTKGAGYDNAAWYLFDANRSGPPRFYGNSTPETEFHPDIEGVL